MAEPHHRPGRRRPHNSFGLAVLCALAVGAAGTFGVLRAADQRTSDITRLDNLGDVLQAQEGPALNYLLIGSDTREGADPNSVDFGAIGDTGDVSGRRSDTIMVLRQEEDGEGAALVSFPRDLWVNIAGRGSPQRINTAYNDGANVLAATITQEFGIPIHHVVDINFFGFKDLVDAAGGIEVCFEFVTRDNNTGLAQEPGCRKLDGTQALAYARSRYYEEFRDGQWRTDPRADLGRIERQQFFISAAVNTTLQRLQADPFLASELIEAAAATTRLDPNLDPVAAAGTLRKAFDTGFTTFQLPVRGETINGAAVLRLEPGAEPILDYFRGTGPLPVEPAS